MVRKILKILGLFSLMVFPSFAQEAGTISSGRLDILRDAGEEGFKRAIEVRSFNFPADHGPHPGYRHEWWYATGNLDGPDGRRFGYELTFFRLALAPEGEETSLSSKWQTPVVFAAHFAVTDAQNEDFEFFHRYARGDQRLAGASADKIWLEDWSLEPSDDTWTLVVADGDIKLELELKQIKPPVLNGEGGLSRKSAAPGNATYYYTLPRLESSGTLTIKGEQVPVNGLTWLDREWGTSALADDQQGWDWFSLHLDDGNDLMFYSLRGADGSRHPFSAGTWVDPEGISQRLGADDVKIKVNDYWLSPLGGRYPSGWQLHYPDKNMTITIKPIMKNQELVTFPRYWEGAVDVTGTRDGKAISGRGYVELTGYSN